jgi:hypothetical protein
MTTLSDFRTRVLFAMGVTTSTERGLTDTNVDEHIMRAVEEFGLYVPLEATADVNVSGGSRTFALTALTRPVRVTAVEYPAGQWPRALLDFDQWGGTVTLDHSPPASGYSVRVYHTQRHLVDGSGSTVDAAHETVIVEGAAAHAILARAMGAANVAESATVAPQTYQHLRVAQTRLERWRILLHRLSAGIGRRQLYTPGASTIRRDAVAWPE